MATIKRNVYINSSIEVQKQTPAYRCATPAGRNFPGIWVNSYGQSYEYYRDVYINPSSGVVSSEEIMSGDCDGFIGHGSGHDKCAGFRPVFNLTYDSDAPRKARKVTNDVYAWDEEKKVTTKQRVIKHVLDIPLANGKTVPMQIDNFDEIAEGKAQVYQLKTFHSIKEQPFTSWLSTHQADYEHSGIDDACEKFYHSLAPEIQGQIASVVMDKQQNYKVTEVKLADNTIGILYNKFALKEITAVELQKRVTEYIESAKTPEDKLVRETALCVCVESYGLMLWRLSEVPPLKGKKAVNPIIEMFGRKR